ncbi:hypothetical protein AAC387_Pa10g2005 [Persea americana]
MCSEGAPIARTITVNWRGGADFTKIQDAINSVPANNKEWVHIFVKEGNYWERVVVDRSFIYLQGQGRFNTFVENSNASMTDKSTTFDIKADNFVAKNIAFKNNHNYAILPNANVIRQAVAARVRADKVAFYNCSFISVQDTLWDDTGRHLYQSCYIKGSVDYIFGAGQSHFENCILEQNGNRIQYQTGFITAQGRENWNDTNGFVFKNCATSGSGKVFLGRAWRPYARVLFYNTYLSENVAPQGWVAWYGAPNVNNLVFAESGCHGPGSNKAGRVQWEKTLSAEELNKLTSSSFIDAEGWAEQQP